MEKEWPLQILHTGTKTGKIGFCEAFFFTRNSTRKHNFLRLLGGNVKTGFTTNFRWFVFDKSKQSAPVVSMYA